MSKSKASKMTIVLHAQSRRALVLFKEYLANAT